MPCPGCGTDAEPALRKPRSFSPEWERDPGTYFGCLSCGHFLARLPAPASERPSDLPLDHLPDPRGLINTFFLPELQRALARWVNAGGNRGRLVSELVRSGRSVAGQMGITVIDGLRLPGREKIVPSLILAGLGNPWVVTFCELPGGPGISPETVDGVLGLETVEVVVLLGVIEESETLRLRLRMIYPEGEDPVPLEGNPISFRRRRKADCAGGSARHSVRPG